MKKRGLNTAAKLMAAILTLNCTLSAAPPLGNLTVWANTTDGYVDEIVDEDDGYYFDDDYDYNSDYDINDPGQNPASTATPSVATLGLATPSNARAVSGITLDTESSRVFANGTAIVIRENNGITSVYDSTSALLSGTTNITGYTVYGGWNSDGSASHVYTGNTSITVESGTLGNVWGGGINDTIVGSTSVTINGGVVKYVLGGSLGGTINGNTSVTINNAKVRHVAGGGENAVVNGTCHVTINENAKIWGNEYSSTSDTRTGDGGVIWGGSIGGSISKGTVNKTLVTLNGGDYGWAYGGGNYCDTTTESHVIVKKMPKAGNVICAGGANSELKKAILDLDGTTMSSNYMTWLFGSGEDDSIGEVQIIIKGTVALPSGMPIYANWAGEPDASTWNTSTVEKATFKIDYHEAISATNMERYPALIGSGVTNDTTLIVNGTTLVNDNPYAYIQNIDHVELNQCHFHLFGYNDASSTVNDSEDLSLKSLKISADSTAEFGLNKSVTIDELSGSGTICFSSHISTKYPPTISVGKLTTTNTAPLQLDLTGTAWASADAISNHVFFDGTGIEALNDASCFHSVRTDYMAVKTDSGIMLKPATEAGTYTHFTTATFDKETYTYGESMNLKVTLKTLANDPVSGTVTITAGNYGTAIASASLDKNGSATISVPVNNFLRDLADNEKYLYVKYPGSNQYKVSIARLSLTGNSSVIYFKTADAEIAFTEAITAPALNKTPQQTLAVSENAFYTAELVWSPDVTIFRADTPYTVSIRLTPKAGYDLSSVSGVSYLNTPLTMTTDGSSLIGEAARYAALSASALTYGSNFKTLPEVPEELKDLYSSVDALQDAMYQQALLELENLSDENVAHYDVILMISLDGGNTWEPAIKGNFPADGLDTYLPYPEGTSADTCEFVVLHMLTSAIGSQRAGDIEVITPELTENGLKCHFNSLSPVTIAWKTTYTPDESISDDSDDSSSGSSGGSSNSFYGGISANGWYLDSRSNQWYYNDPTHGILKGWYWDNSDKNWYYLDPTTGAMRVGWQLIDGKWYYLNAIANVPAWSYDAQSRTWIYTNTQILHPYGAMYQNETTPDGYIVGNDGSWVSK